MNILFIKHFFVGFIVSEIPRVSVFGLCPYSVTFPYIGISLSTIAQKITNKLILNRIQPFINPILRNSQNSFMPGRTTTTHITHTYLN